MKKLSLIFVAIMLCAVFFGCNNTNTTSNVDLKLVGAWVPITSSQTECYIFSEDSTIEIVRGSVSFAGEASFVSTGVNTGKYMSNFYYMSGELTYTFSDNLVTFDDGAGTTLTLIKTEFNAPELAVYDDFDSKNPLVGTWVNEEYCDAYIFNADGTASYYMEIAELEYTSYIDYTYTEKDGVIYLTYDAGDGVQETTEEYEITGDVLNILSIGEYTRQ